MKLIFIICTTFFVDTNYVANKIRENAYIFISKGIGTFPFLKKITLIFF